jgi:phage shock protein C
MSTSRPLHRSRRNRVLGGVCWGVAQWLGWSPTVGRIAYVVVSVCSAAFPGMLVYVILWLVMPLENRSSSAG